MWFVVLSMQLNVGSRNDDAMYNSARSVRAPSQDKYAEVSQRQQGKHLTFFRSRAFLKLCKI